MKKARHRGKGRDRRDLPPRSCQAILGGTDVESNVGKIGPFVEKCAHHERKEIASSSSPRGDCYISRIYYVYALFRSQIARCTSLHNRTASACWMQSGFTMRFAIKISDSTIRASHHRRLPSPLRLKIIYLSLLKSTKSSHRS